jgi:dUTP pyrophosphatase
MIKFHALYEDSIIPVRSTIASAGYDLYAHEDVEIQPHQTALIGTGITAEMSANSVMYVCSRSGLALKNSVIVLNAPGIVDADYYPNEIKVILHNLGNEVFKVNKCDRIAQALFTSYYIAYNETTPNQKRESGFGSTGTK